VGVAVGNGGGVGTGGGVGVEPGGSVGVGVSKGGVGVGMPLPVGVGVGLVTFIINWPPQSGHAPIFKPQVPAGLPVHHPPRLSKTFAAIRTDSPGKILPASIEVSQVIVDELPLAFSIRCQGLFSTEQ